MLVGKGTKNLKDAWSSDFSHVFNRTEAPTPKRQSLGYRFGTWFYNKRQ